MGQNCGPAEELQKSSNHCDKHPLRQYLIDKSDPELRRIVHLIKLQKGPFRDEKSMSSVLTGRIGRTESDMMIS
jgi:hypothetical protein